MADIKETNLVNFKIGHNWKKGRDSVWTFSANNSAQRPALICCDLKQKENEMQFF